jgi:hypothetical protein
MEYDDKGKAKVRDNLRREPKRENWKPPPHGWVKINTYAGYSVDIGGTNAGVVIRDERGRVILAAWQMLNPCSSPEAAKAKAFLWSIRLCTK